MNYDHPNAKAVGHGSQTWSIPEWIGGEILDETAGHLLHNYGP